MTRFIALAASACVLVGCGGGGGGDESPAPAPATQSAAGIWQGTLTQGGSVVNEVSCLVTQAGALACLLINPANDDLAGAAYGTVQVTNGNQLSGSGTSYAAPGYVLADGTSVRASFSITAGTVSERGSLALTISSLGQSGTVSAIFDPIYDRDSALATVAGSYTVFDVFGDPASFSIDANGALFSQTASGCVGNGQVSVVNPQFNGYNVSVTVSNCPGLNGSYTGLGVTTDAGSGTNNVFLFGIFNTVSAILGAPLK